MKWMPQPVSITGSISNGDKEVIEFVFRKAYFYGLPDHLYRFIMTKGSGPDTYDVRGKSVAIMVFVRMYRPDFDEFIDRLEAHILEQTEALGHS